MRWPWISRAAYDDVVRQNDRLLDAVINPPPEVVTVVADAPALPQAPPLPRERSIVAEAITSQAGGDAKLAAHLGRYARELKLSGKTPEEVAHALTEWITTEDSQPTVEALT